MRPLKRPMFKYGGDVKKQGIMHGMNGLRDGGVATTMADATGYAGGGMTMPNMRGRVTGPGGYAGLKDKVIKGAKIAGGTGGSIVGYDFLANLLQAIQSTPFQNGGLADLPPMRGMVTGPGKYSQEKTLIDTAGNILKKSAAKTAGDIKTGRIANPKNIFGKKAKVATGILSNIYNKGKNFFNIQTVPKFQRANPYAKVGLRGPIDKIPFLQRVKDFARLNPKATYGTLGVGTTSGVLPIAGAKIAEGLGNIGLQAADLAVSDKIFDQDKVIGSSVKDIYGKVRKKLGFEDKKDGVDKVLTEEQKQIKALQDQIATMNEKKTITGKPVPTEEDKLKRIYSLLGVDRAQRGAASKALADMSRYIDEGGKDTISRKNIGSTLTKGILAFDKRLDKVDQLKEAAGLMMAKGEIEAMSDPYGKEFKKLSVEEKRKAAKDAKDPRALALTLPNFKGRTLSHADTISLAKIKDADAVVLADSKKAKDEGIGKTITADDYVKKQIELDTSGDVAGVYIVDKVIIQVDKQGNRTQLLP
jgi:hypothetical protein